MWADLIGTARRLARANANRPRQSDLKRAVSTAYYAVFHALSEECANLLLGGGPDVDGHAWAQLYRGIDHGPAKTACEGAARRGFPNGILVFADTFVELQKERLRADYDPYARFDRPGVLDLIVRSELAIAGLRSESRHSRRAFVVWTLMRPKR